MSSTHDGRTSRHDSAAGWQDAHMTTPPLSTYSSEIYLYGMGGKRPDITTDLSALEAYAKDRMEPQAFWYAAGAAGSGATYRGNLEAFDRWRIVPRMLAGAAGRNPQATVLGTTI